MKIFLNSNAHGATVNGVPVKLAEVFQEGGMWRWRIVNDSGQEFVDGGNFTRRSEAEASLEEALDPRPTAVNDSRL